MEEKEDACNAIGEMARNLGYINEWVWLLIS